MSNTGKSEWGQSQSQSLQGLREPAQKLHASPLLPSHPADLGLGAACQILPGKISKIRIIALRLWGTSEIRELADTRGTEMVNELPW